MRWREVPMYTRRQQTVFREWGSSNRVWSVRRYLQPITVTCHLFPCPQLPCSAPTSPMIFQRISYQPVRPTMCQVTMDGQDWEYHLM
nr:hypothetical protein I308_03663 [Cryptococcus tetragattii IND107]